MPDINLDLPINVDDFDLDLPTFDNSGIEDIEMSAMDNIDFDFSDADFASDSNFVSTNIPSGNNSGSTSNTGSNSDTKQGGAKINKELCKKFTSAPSCEYIPAQYRDLCNECKSAGF